MEILNNIISKFNIDLIKNNIYSASGLSFNIFFNNFNNNKISIKYNKEVDYLIRPSYYGGRCETFGNIKDNEQIYHFDFSGMYAQCMLEKFPFGKNKIKFSELDINKPGFYRIKYESKDMHIPILPHHDINNHKLMFTNGVNEGTYWFEEIDLFIKNGGLILNVYYGVEYENYGTCFKDFVEYFSKLKAEGENYKTFAKLIINSLYGRFGMGESNEYSTIVWEKELDWWFKNFEIISCNSINKLNYIKVKINKKLIKIINKSEFNTTLSNVAIASAISSKARIKLIKAFNDVKSNGGDLKYCDTDSLFVGFKKDILDEKHGEVYWDSKKKDTIIENSIFIAPKLYGVKFKNIEVETIKIKGISNPQIRIEDLKKSFYNNKTNIKFKQTQFSRKNFIIKTEEIEKNLNFNFFNKRIWNKSKNETTPYTYINGKYENTDYTYDRKTN